MVNAPLTMSLSAALPDARMVRLTRDLERDLAREGIKAHPIEATTAPGERGDTITFGVLILALVTSGSIKALIGCLKAYVSREPSLTIKLCRPNGMQIELNAHNMDGADVRATLEAVASETAG